MRNSPTSIMLFAAGFGSRMKHLTADCPKPLIQVAGKALIDHSLSLARAAQPKVILANLHYLPEQIEAHLADSDVHTITETPDILETGGGLRNALPILGTNPVVTMNSDAIWAGPNPVTAAIEAWDPTRMDALLVCVPVARCIGHSGTGDFTLNAEGHLTRGAGWTYGGVQILKTDRLAAVPDRSFSLNIIWDQMRSDKRLFGLSYTGKWCDVGHPSGIALAEEMLHV